MSAYLVGRVHVQVMRGWLSVYLVSLVVTSCHLCVAVPCHICVLVLAEREKRT